MAKLVPSTRSSNEPQPGPWTSSRFPLRTDGESANNSGGTGFGQFGALNITRGENRRRRNRHSPPDPGGSRRNLVAGPNGGRGTRAVNQRPAGTTNRTERSSAGPWFP